MKNHYAIRLLIFGIIALGFGLSALPDHIVFRSQLTQLKGTLFNSNILIETVSSRGRKSQRSTLTFYLNEHRKKFTLVENIGDYWANLEYNQIQRDLQNSNEITISIKESQLDEYEPKVFEISSNQKVILAFEDVKDKNRLLIVFLIAMGIGSIVTWYYFRNRTN